MNKKIEGAMPEFRSMEDEREYWEARGPLGYGSKGKINSPALKEQRRSFLSVRLSGAELTRLRDLAINCGCGPSTLARQVLVSLMDQAEKAKTQQNKKAVRTITLDELCKLITKKMPETFTQKAEALLNSAVIGGVGGPSFMVMDAAQFEDLKEMGAKFIALLFESSNPNIRVITPYDANYDKVRATLTEKDSVSGEVKV